MSDKPRLTSQQLFKNRVYDILTNRAKLEPVPPIGSLSGEDSALLSVITVASSKFQEDTAMEMAEAAFDGIALTLLTIYREGLPKGGGLLNQNMQRVAEILAKAGENDRAGENESLD